VSYINTKLLYLRQISTAFQSSFIATHSKKFAIKASRQTSKVKYYFTNTASTEISATAGATEITGLGNDGPTKMQGWTLSTPAKPVRQCPVLQFPLNIDRVVLHCIVLALVAFVVNFLDIDKARYCYRMLSVCPSATLVICGHVGWLSSKVQNCGNAVTCYKNKLEVVGLPHYPWEGLTTISEHYRKSKLNVMKQNHHKNITFNNICQLTSAATGEFRIAQFCLHQHAGFQCSIVQLFIIARIICTASDVTRVILV